MEQSFGSGSADNSPAHSVHLVICYWLIGTDRCSRGDCSSPGGLAIPYLESYPYFHGQPQCITMICEGTPLAGPLVLNAKTSVIDRLSDFVSCGACCKLKQFPVAHLIHSKRKYE